jgi:hypothetical protein
MRVDNWLAGSGRCGVESVWLPENAVLQLFLSTFLNVSGGPGMDSNLQAL